MDIPLDKNKCGRGMATEVREHVGEGFSRG